MGDAEDTVVMAIESRLPCQVLLIDDNDVSRARLSAMLESAGYRFNTASSGAEALRLLERDPCSVVISDWAMPDMDGIALTRQLRARRLDHYVYILLLTLGTGNDDVVAALQAGADDLISKEASEEELLARLESARRIVSLEQSLRAAKSENGRLAVTDALTDALTGARNSRYLEKHLPREYDRSKRYGHPLAVLVFDLDNFKSINDDFGHDAGDDVLRELCARTQDLLRASDWLARAGGQQFVVVLPETDLSGARVVGERLRQAMAATPVRSCAGSINATVSVGVAAISTPRDLPRLACGDLIRVADRCLHQSKQQGRNRVTAASVDVADAHAGGAPDVLTELRLLS